MQAFTAAVLILAANTAYNGFPILASILGRDGYLPKQLGRRGDRLAYSNGILLLTLFAGGLVYLFDASTTRLIQLYILGVFLSFTLSQSGMVIHWNRELRKPGIGHRASIKRSRLANFVGAIMTASVLVIVLFSKFTHGAWMVTIAVPVLVLVMVMINRHYRRVDSALRLPPGGVTLPSRVHSVVLVSRLQQPTMHALALARATRPSSLVGLHVQTDVDEANQLRAEWDRRGIPLPLVIVDSPYRDITRPVLNYVEQIHRQVPGTW